MNTPAPTSAALLALTLILVTCAAAPPQGAAGADPAGCWEGTLSRERKSRRLVLEVESGHEQRRSGRLHWLSVDSHEFPLDIELEGQRLRFVAGEPGEEATFSLVLSEDGERLEGRWLQGERDHALAFTRVQAPAPQAGDPRGLWAGSTEVGEGTLRLRLRIVDAPCGALMLTLDSPDQAQLGLPCTALSWRAEVLLFELDYLGFSAEATLAADGQSLEVRMRQGRYAFESSRRRLEHEPELRRPQEPKGPLPYATEAVSVDHAEAGVRLAGTMTIPAGQGPFPAVVLVSGSGPQDRDETVFDHKPFLVLADHLTRRGIAVLRYDDRGCGASTGAFSGATSAEFALDALACLRWLRARTEVDATALGLIGHSEGGVVAPLAAVRDSSVRYLVLLAGPSLRGDDMLVAQGRALQRASGVSDQQVEEDARVRGILFEALAEEPDDRRALSLMEARYEAWIATLAPERARAVRERFDGESEESLLEMLRRFREPWMRFFLDLDPRQALGEVRCPVLALFGERDVQVPPRANAGEMARALAEGACSDYSVVTLPGLNHMFQSCGSGAIGEYAEIEETMAPSALDAVSDWILRRVPENDPRSRAR